MNVAVARLRWRERPFLTDVEYRPDGNVRLVLTGAAYATSAQAKPERVLIPDLDDIMPAVENPDDFAGPLKVGTILLHWGDADRAQGYLEKAVQASSRQKPAMRSARKTP